MKARKITLSPNLLLLFVVFFFWFANYSYVPILSTYSQSLGASYTLIGMIVGSYGFIQIFARLPIGMASDALGRRRIFLLFGAVATVLSGIGFYFSVSAVWLLVFRSVSGVAVSTWAIQMTAYSSSFGESGRVKAIGVISSVQALGQVFGTFFGGLLAQFLGDKATFAATFFASMIAVFLLFFYPEAAPRSRLRGDPGRVNTSNQALLGLKIRRMRAAPPAPIYQTLRSEENSETASLQPAEAAQPLPERLESGPSLRQTLSVFQDRHLLWFSGACMLMQIVSQGACLGFVNNILRDLGANSFTLGMSSTLVSFPAVFSTVLAVGFLRKKFGAKPTLVVYFVVMSVSVVAYAFIKDIYLILALQFVCGFCKGAISTLLTGVATSKTPPNLRSAATGLFQAIYGIGMTAGPFIAGIFLDKYNLATAFIALGVLTFLGAIAVLVGDTGDRKVEVNS